jgi:hypothetical protein
MSKKIADPNTGEVTIIQVPRASTVAKLPDMKNLKSVREVAGKNPPAVNLRDHPEFNGLNCIMGDGKINPGEEGDYYIGVCFIFPDSVTLDEENKDDYAFTLMTGSSNILDRYITAKESGSLPMIGTFRKAGRAWFLD